MKPKNSPDSLTTTRTKLDAFLDKLNLDKRERSEFRELVEALLAAKNAEMTEEVEPKLELPDKAPELYAERANRKENALTFLRRVWGLYLDAGVLYQDQLTHYDYKLGKAVSNQVFMRQKSGIKEFVSDYIPPKKKRMDREIEELHLTPKQLNALRTDRRKSLRLIRNICNR